MKFIVINNLRTKELEYNSEKETLKELITRYLKRLIKKNINNFDSSNKK